MTPEELIAQRTSNAAMSTHIIADQLDEVARRMLVLVKNATTSKGWSTHTMTAFRKLSHQRRAALNALKTLGEEL